MKNFMAKARGSFLFSSVTLEKIKSTVGTLVLLTTPLQTLGEIDDNSKVDEEKRVSWHKSLSEKALTSIDSVGDYAQSRWRGFTEKMGFNEPRHIAAYRGYATSTTVYVQGRLLANKLYRGPQDDDNWWDNLKATYERWESDEIPDAKIRLTYIDQTVDVVTDEEGYYSATFKLHKKFPKSDFVTATHELEDRVLSSVHHISILDASADYLVISDLDDTVIHTSITDLLLSAQLTFLNNAKTRKPLLGVGSLYQSLAKGKHEINVNPILYVSNSAWNMYDLLRDFLDLNDLPRGPLLLRDIGFGANSSNHKMETIAKLLKQYAPLPVVLIGDSGQHDADYYSSITARYPGRVKAIYIRDVDPDSDSDSEYDIKVDNIILKSEDIGVPFARVQASDQVAAHAVKIGLLPAREIAPISRDTDKDRTRETVSEKVGILGQKE